MVDFWGDAGVATPWRPPDDPLTTSFWPPCTYTLHVYDIFTGLTRRRSAADLGATPSFHRLLSRPVTLRDPLGISCGPLGDPWKPLGDALGIPGNPLGILGDSSGTPWRSLGDLRRRLGICWGRLADLLWTTYKFFLTL